MTMFRVLRDDPGLPPAFIADIDAATPLEACRKAAYHDPARGIVDGRSHSITATYEAHVRDNASRHDLTWHDARFYS